MTATPAARDERADFEFDYVACFNATRPWGVAELTVGKLYLMRTGPNYGAQPVVNDRWNGWQARAALAESELAEVRADRDQQYDMKVKAREQLDMAVLMRKKAEGERDELRAELERVKQFRDELEKTCLDTKQRFKNFHSSLCDRFGYTHDDKYWWRDLISLEEHIAKAAIGAGEGEAG